MATRQTTRAAARTATKTATKTTKVVGRIVKKATRIAAKSKPSKKAAVKTVIEKDIAERAKNLKTAKPFDNLLAGYDNYRNPIDRAKAELRDGVAQVIKKDINFLVLYGPPGIGKTRDIEEMLAVYYAIEKAKWEKTPDEDKDPRRTMLNEKTDELEFRPPFTVITGGISFPEFYKRLYWSSKHGEILFIDDAITLRDPRIQSALQQATDPQTNGRVQYGFKAKLVQEDEPDVPKEFYFDGGVIVCTNFRKDEMGKSERSRQLFGDALLDRIDGEVEFTHERQWLYDYVNREAFEKRGLLTYLKAGKDAKIPKSKRGLAFAGSDADCDRLMGEVQAFFIENIDRVKSISFRTVRKMLRARVNSPREWVSYCTNNYLRAVDKKKEPKARIDTSGAKRLLAAKPRPAPVTK